MAAHPYILARTMKDAHEFARGPLGLVYGQYRIVNSPSTIKSVRGADLYLVPGHQNRFDRFAMKGAIRWTRMNVIDVEADGLPQPEPQTDGLTPPGVQQSLDFDDLFSEVGKPVQFTSQVQTAVVVPDAVGDFFDLPDPEPQPTLDGGEALEPQPETSTKRRRRSRCKDCGELHFKDEACPSNDESV